MREQKDKCFSEMGQKDLVGRVRLVARVSATAS